MSAGAEIPPGSVVITPQDMWDAIGRIETATNDIKNALTPQVVDLRADHNALAEKHGRLDDRVDKDIEPRLRVVERANWKQAGIYAAITLVAGIGEAWFYLTHR